MLPSIGVVLSLGKEAGISLLRKLNGKIMADGYYSINEPSVIVGLDPPEGFKESEWNDMKWAYGGGMTLISDESGKMQNDSVENHLIAEGWLSPLSMQTQESEIHKLTCHPRTALGLTRDGKLFVLVFSGRTVLSQGVDYHEMCTLANKMIPNIKHMINVDGGASSVLGAVIRRSFVELSYPAASDSTCAGMSRKINTIFCMEFTK
jgi:hypothetical protein